MWHANKVLSLSLTQTLCDSLALKTPFNKEEGERVKASLTIFEQILTAWLWLVGGTCRNILKKIQIAGRFQSHCSLFTKFSLERISCVRNPRQENCSEGTPDDHPETLIAAQEQKASPRCRGSRARLWPPCCRGRFPAQADPALQWWQACPPENQREVIWSANQHRVLILNTNWLVGETRLRWMQVARIHLDARMR